MVEPKTVSNLPIDVSIRWAEDQKFLEESKPIMQDAGGISRQVQTDVILPSSQSQVETLLGLFGRHPTWAMFQMPQGFQGQRRRIFTSKLVSLLGNDEQQDALIGRIQGVSGDEEERDAWEEEKNRILGLMKLMNTLNKDLIDIISRCKQYQKG